MKYFAYFFTFLLVPTLGYSQQKPDTFKHYAAHILTDVAAHIAAGVSIGAGIVIGGALAKDKSSGLATTSVIAGIAAGLYAIYKTPQWTDKFILKYAKERSTSQNVITFACRLLLQVPIGTLLGELVVQKNFDTAS